MRRLACAACLLVCFPAAAPPVVVGAEPLSGEQRATGTAAAAAADADAALVRLGASQTMQLRVGLIVTAQDRPAKNLLCTTPVPIAWPEQQVRLVDDEFSAHVGEVQYVMVGDSVKQMVITIPHLAPGEEARAITTFEIVRSQLIGPEQPVGLRIPAKPDRSLKTFLAAGPGTESRSPKIKSLAKELTAEPPDAWAKVKAIYEWVRGNVEYRNGSFRGALAALKDGYGDCEEMTALFCALCRASGIPARTVWVPGHCYPEFYLEDEDGQGHWFPCQAAGSFAFGSMPELRPIFQKGDNFVTKERPRERMRYVSEFLTGTGGSPKHQFIREVLGQLGDAGAPLAPAEVN